MHWLNVNRTVVESEAMQDAAPEAVRAWLFLSVFCAGQENGGRIVGARTWNERKWLRLSGVTLPKKPSALWRWDGDDLVVEFYPHAHEAAAQAMRSGGSKGGQKRAANALAAKAQAPLAAAPQDNSIQGNSIQEKGSPYPPEISVPGESEIRTWAQMSGVAEEFAVQKWRRLTQDHGWEKNGRLIDWRDRFLDLWVRYGSEWVAEQKNRVAKNGARPPGWRDGDQDWWWTEAPQLLEGALDGEMRLGRRDGEVAVRLREILKIRKGT